MRKENKQPKILYFIFLLSLFIYPLGQLPKLSIFPQIKITLLDFILTVFIILSFLKGFRINRNLKSPLRYQGIGFVGIALISLLSAIFRTPINQVILGFIYLIRFCIYFVFYLALDWVFYKYKSKRKFIGRGLLFAGFSVAFFGLLQYFLYPDLRNLLYLGWDPHYYRLFSTFFDPNFTGIILVLTIIQFIFLVQKNKLIYWVMFLITCIALFLTKSRSAFFSLIVGLVCLYWIGYRLRKTFLLGFIISIIIVFLIPHPPVDVFNLLRSESSLARINNWILSFMLGFKYPLFGQGFGIIRFSDSSFLYTWVVTGLAGLITLTLFFIKIFRIAFLGKKKLLISTIVIFVSSWFNNTIFYPFILYWLFLMLVEENQDS